MLFFYFIFFLFSTQSVLSNKTEIQKSEKQQVQSYQSCQVDADCKENSFCFGNDEDKDGNCKCLKDYILVFRNTTYYECRKAAKPGEPCDKDFDCNITLHNSICNKYKLCECNNKSVEYNGQCYEKAKLGEACLVNENCYINDGTKNGSFGLCVSRRCICRSNQIASKDGTTCFNTRKIGESCVFDEECQFNISNTKCSDVCRCANGYTLSRDDTTCVKAATQFGENCDFDGQCSEVLTQSVCTSERKCGCLNGYHQFYIKCRETRRIGQSCDEDAQCLYDKKLYENVKCGNGTCICIFGKTEDGSCRLEKISDNSSSTICHSFFIFLLLLCFLA